MDPFTVVLLASQLYMSASHTEPPEHWPDLKVTITESSQIFPDACNRGGATSWSRYFGLGTVACANTNLLTRMCHVTYSTNPLATVFVIGLPFANRMLLNHELEHCRGADHPLPGSMSLAEGAKIWHDLGQPYATPADWAEIEALAERTGGLRTAEVEAEITRRMPGWVEAGKQYAVELALKDKEEARKSAVGVGESGEVAGSYAADAVGAESAEMPPEIGHRVAGRDEPDARYDATEHALSEAAASVATDVGTSESTEAALLADI